MDLPISSVVGALERPRFSGSDGASLPLMLNPKALSITRTANWNRSAPNISTSGPTPSSSGGGGGGALGAAGAAIGAVAGGVRSAAAALAGGGITPGGPVVAGHTGNTFTGSQPGTLAMTVWFDDSFNPTGDITPSLNILQNWTHIPTAATTAQPPKVTFTWGQIRFPGYMKSVAITYKLFGMTGSPLRAEVVLSMAEEPDPPGTQNPTSGGIAGRRARMLGAGDSLQSIATAEYGRPGLWRALAEANDIDDPLRIRPGTSLLVPPKPEAAASR